MGDAQRPHYLKYMLEALAVLMASGSQVPLLQTRGPRPHPLLGHVAAALPVMQKDRQ